MKFNVIALAKTGMHFFQIQPALLKGLEFEKRVICQIGELSFHCALMKNKAGQFYVYISKDKMKKLSVKPGMTVKPKFRKDDSLHQFEFPMEFKEVLRSDKDARIVFKKLTAGGQRALLYLVQRIKSSEKRIEKALVIADKLRHGVTSPKLMK